MIPVRVHQHVIYLILHGDALEDRGRLQRTEAIFRELLRARELGLHGRVVEELLVVFEVLDAALVDGRVGPVGRGEVDVVLGREDWEGASGARQWMSVWVARVGVSDVL